MAPPRPPPELNDDAVREILLYLPPDDPAHLVRASLVSKHWRRILSDQGFLRRYRRFHRTPPLLGFFHDGGCDDDHLHCAGGPIHLSSSCVLNARGIQRACIYSSKTGAWSAPASVKASLYFSVEPNRGALVGDKIFFTLSQGEEILKYDLGKQRLSLIDPPALYRYRLNTVLMGSKIGLLGLAGIMNSESSPVA
ncbi:hypothetical protein PR202_gb12126 [Eleusine coracana subsp. coracana]|uniref:F-box domain-containing protein n=1 Tax=Eleusine coracana subsp. coracana TaxID=191504 RepID=A0AAV5ELZ5_ELECO|nr:hypothetical protein PR202_gb12126 [Eleusine coracana subsp. coracana]